MTAIPKDVKELFDAHKNTFKYYALATSSKEGVPNVVPIGFLWVENEHEIWIVDNFLNKTLANLKENPVAAVYAIGTDGHTCVQVKGAVRYSTAGPEYQKAHDLAKAKSDKYPAKGLVRIIVTDLFNTTPGPDAGKKY